MDEVFKDIVGYEGIYQISNLGNVKSLERTCLVRRKSNSIRLVKERILKPSKNTGGYLQVMLYSNNGATHSKGNWHLLHRLIAIAFITNPKNKREVNHVNGTKADNRLENLEWATPKENSQHAYINKMKLPLMGETNGNSILTGSKVLDIKNRLKNGESIHFLSTCYSVSASTISHIKTGRSWKCLNY